jgi:hypothetical protein
MLCHFSETFKILFENIKTLENVKTTGVLKYGDVEVITFNFKDIKAEIHYVDFGLVEFLTSTENQELDNVITEFISEFFGYDPCLSYKEKHNDIEAPDGICKKWDLNDEDALILNTMHILANEKEKKRHSIKILTGKSEEYYYERLKKIPGIYTGNLKDEEISMSKNCSEFNMFYMINERCLELRKHLPDGEPIDLTILNEEEEEIRFALEYLIVASSRFGTEVKASTDFSSVDLPMEYAIWLSCWRKYLYEILEPVDTEILSEMAENFEDVYPILTTYNSDMYSDGLKHIYIDTRYLKK